MLRSKPRTYPRGAIVGALRAAARVGESLTPAQLAERSGLPLEVVRKNAIASGVYLSVAKGRAGRWVAAVYVRVA